MKHIYAAVVMGITRVKHFFMAFIGYISQAETELLVKSFVHKLENYGINIPNIFRYSKQLFAELRIPNNNFSKVNLLISWVNQTQKPCSIEIWSDEPFSKNKTFCRKVYSDMRELIKPLNLSSKIE